MKVLLSGYYGFGNIGDDAVLEAIIKGLRKTEPKINPPTKTPGKQRGRFGGGIKITVLSAAPQLTRELEAVESVHRYAWLKIFLKMLGTDVFVSGGGTLFQNATSNRSFLYYIGLVLLAKLLFKKTVIFAQGFGPLRGRFHLWLAKRILNRVDLLMLRDRDSYEAVRNLGINKPRIFLTADPSAILKVPTEGQGRRILSLEAVKTDKPLVGIAVRGLPRRDEVHLYKVLSRVVDWLAQSHNYSPVFILLQCPEDMMETAKVINTMQEKSNVVFKLCRPKEMLSLISQFDLLIGMRLHALIFAAMNAVPMLGLSYDPKVEAFMKTVGQPYWKLDKDLTAEDLKTELKPLLAEDKKRAARLARKARDLRAQAELNFKLFFEYCRPKPPRKKK